MYDLLSAAQDGDRAALEAVLASHRATVFRYSLRFCRTTEDAEDAVQETLWTAARSIKTFRRAAAITTWLFIIVRNTCHRLARQHRSSEDLADVLALSSGSGEPLDDRVAAEQLEELLAVGIARLRPEHRDVILLRDVEGLTAPEAASRRSITVRALKSRLHRARAELRSHLQRVVAERLTTAQ